MAAFRPDHVRRSALYKAQVMLSNLQSMEKLGIRPPLRAPRPICQGTSACEHGTQFAVGRCSAWGLR